MTARIGLYFMTLAFLVAIVAGFVGLGQRDQARDEWANCIAASQLWERSAQYALKGDIYAANDAAMAAEALGCEVPS